MFAQSLVWTCCEAALMDPGIVGNSKLMSPFHGFSFCLSLGQVATTFMDTPLPFGDTSENAPESGQEKWGLFRVRMPSRFPGTQGLCSPQSSCCPESGSRGWPGVPALKTIELSSPLSQTEGARAPNSRTGV